MQRLLLCATAMLVANAGNAQDIVELPPTALPVPSMAPLAESDSTDAILKLARTLSDADAFREVIGEAVKASPVIAEGKADEAAAVAGKRNAQAQLLPRIDVTLSANRSLARDFSNDPDNVIERARGNGRVDSILSAEQILIDFGAAQNRVNAAILRIDASEAELDRKTETVALRAIGVWYELFAYGHLVDLAQNYVDRTNGLRGAVEQRIAQGVAAPVERARLESAMASGKLRLAQFQQALGSAQARFRENFGLQPPVRLARAPAPGLSDYSGEQLAALAGETSSVRSAEAQAKAAKEDLRAANADTLPKVTAGVDAARYGLFEPGRRDYDVRGRLTLRVGLFGPGFAREQEAKARADAAAARADTVRLEAEREARIAWSDVRALASTLDAYEADYRASRITRDAVTERFRVARGTLFDALDGEERLLAAAASYIQAMAELDSTTYVALARSGELLDHLKIPPADRKNIK
jgi:outer membrane protein, adhesin transport system